MRPIKSWKSPHKRPFSIVRGHHGVNGRRASGVRSAIWEDGMHVRMLSVIALVALLVSSAVLAQVKKSEMPGVRNYSRVDATVGCGGAVDPTAMSALQQGRATSRSSIFGWPTRPGRMSMPGELRRRPPDSSTSTCRSTPPHPIPRWSPTSWRGCRQVQPAGLHPLRIGQSRRRGVDDQARPPGWMGRGPGADGSGSHRTAEPAARGVCDQLHQGTRAEAVAGAGLGIQHPVTCGRRDISDRL